MKASILKRRILLVFLMHLLCLSAAFGQHRPGDLLTSANWDIIGTLNFMERGNDIYPIFSAELRQHANKDFELTGYMIPIREGLKQSRFLLSTLPVNQCFYCGQNGIPAMILVEMSEPIKFTYRPVKLKGKLKLKKVNIRDYPPITLGNAGIPQ